MPRNNVVLLVSDYGADVHEWQAALRQYNENLNLRVWPEVGDPLDVSVILVDTVMKDKGGFAPYTNLCWVAYLGAGAGDVLSDPTLAKDVTVTRLMDQQLADGMRILALSAALSHHQRLLDYRGYQQQKLWKRERAKPPRDFIIGMLGLGFIGRQAALAIKACGFSVSGWSRTPTSIGGVNCLSGEDGLNQIITQSDMVISILPETRETRQLFDASLFKKFKPGAAFANFGRGSLVNEQDLLVALANGQVHSAYLDVFQKESLPSDSPLWGHSRVVITPHTGGNLGSGKESKAQVAANYGRLIADSPLENRVRRDRGY